MMKIIIFSCLLLIINNVMLIHGQAEANDKLTDNVRNVLGLSSRTRKNMKSSELSNYQLCSQLRQLDLLFEEDELRKVAETCDSPGSKMTCEKAASSVTDYALKVYQDHSYCTFHVCTYWKYEKMKVQGEGKCAHVDFLDAIIDVSCRCSFLKPLVEAFNDVGTKEDMYADSCVRYRQKTITEAITVAFAKYEICKDRTMLVGEFSVDSDVDRCVPWNIVSGAQNHIKKCFQPHLQTFNRVLQEFKGNGINCSDRKTTNINFYRYN